jgi:hypothetical protein
MGCAQDSKRRKLAWLLLALGLFALATADRYAAVFEAGIERAIPSRVATRATIPHVRGDQQFVVWAVSRNARTLARHPTRLYNAQQCFPEPRSLTLGEPVLAMGILGIPARLLSQDPVVTYNVVVLLMSMCAALAMYWLITEWTGTPAAGVVAGLLYAFHGLAIHDPLHPYSSDTTWMVLALVFANRLFATGRWRDAAGLAASASMQLATSFYSFVAAGLIGLVFVTWLALRSRLRHVRPLQLVFVAVLVLLAGGLVFGPYLDTGDGVLATREGQWFRPWRAYAAGGPAFFGWAPSALVLAGLVIPARLSLRGIPGDPRPALVIGGLLVAAVAAGSFGTLGVDVYALLSAWAPGFDTVRIPWKISIGVHLASCLIAGFGAAGLIAAWRWRGRSMASLALVAITFVSLIWGPGRANPIALKIRPPAESLQFFEGLAAQGNDGPIFVTPLPKSGDGYSWPATAGQLLVAAYHHRPVSACYPSHPSSHQAELEGIERRLPDPKAIRQLGELGFTTIVVRHLVAPRPRTRPARSAYGRAFEQLANRPNAPIRAAHETLWATAYEVVQDAGD